jgi:hypothetical protein
VRTYTGRVTVDAAALPIEYAARIRRCVESDCSNAAAPYSQRCPVCRTLHNMTRVNAHKAREREARAAIAAAQKSESAQATPSRAPVVRYEIKNLERQEERARKRLAAIQVRLREVFAELARLEAICPR